MDFLYLLAEAKEAPIITESFLKWVCGFMGLAISGLFYFLRDLVKSQLADKNKQIEEAPAKQKALESSLENRYKSRLADRDTRIVSLEKELTIMRVERLKFLQAQIEDAKLQEKGLTELSEDYNNLVINHIEPLLEQGANDREQLKRLIERCVVILEYYRKKRERTP